MRRRALRRATRNRNENLQSSRMECILITMPIKPKKWKPGKQSMTEALRAALRDCGSLYAVELVTGVKRQTCARFLSGTQSLRLDIADRLAEHFGIRFGN